MQRAALHVECAVPLGAVFEYDGIVLYGMFLSTGAVLNLRLNFIERDTNARQSNSRSRVNLGVKPGTLNREPLRSGGGIFIFTSVTVLSPVERRDVAVTGQLANERASERTNERTSEGDTNFAKRISQFHIFGTIGSAVHFNRMLELTAL